MAEHGPNSPGTVANDSSVGSAAWSNPSNAAAQDDAYATAAMGFFGTSQRLKATNFGFSGLAGDIIGIKVEIERFASGTSVSDLEVRLINGSGALVGDNKPAGGSYATSDTDSYETYGGAEDDWAAGLTVADIEDADFGVAFRASNGAFGSRTAYVDHVRVTVYTVVTGQQIFPAVEADSALALDVSATPAPDVEAYVGIAFDPAEPNVFIDMSDRRRQYRSRRGRGTNLDRPQAGTCEIELNDGDGALDPTNALSPYAPIWPLRQVRVYRRKDGVTYNRFRGRIERWQPEWAPPSWQYMRIACADIFEQLANTPLVSDQATLTIDPVGANNAVVFTAVEAGGQGDDITIEYRVEGTDTELDASKNEPVSGTAYVKGEMRSGALGNLFGSLLGGQRGRSSIIPVNITIQGLDVVFQIATDGGGNPTSTANDIIATVAANPDLAALVTAELAPGNDGTGVVTAWAATNLAGGKFPAETSGDRIERVLDRIGIPAWMRDLDAGAHTVIAKGFGRNENVSVLSHLQDVADSELGYLFAAGDGKLVYHDGAHRATAERSTTVQAVFSDDGTGYKIQLGGLDQALDKDRIINEATVTAGADTAIPQTARDQDSIDLFSDGQNVPRGIVRQTQLEDDAAALDQAERLVAAFAWPITRFERVTVIDKGEDDSYLDSVLPIEIGDRIKVRLTPPAHSTTVEFEAHVEAIEDDWAYDRHPQTTFRVTPVSQAVGAPPQPTGVMLNKWGTPLILDDPVEGVLAA